MTEDDPFNLNRFVEAQADTYQTALAELQRGRKRGHWIWYVLPQFQGLGRTSTAQAYAINSIEEAKEYLTHPLLGPRLIECFQALLQVEGKTIHEIVGSPDDLKVRSSATLFLIADPKIGEFQAVLDKYYQGAPDDLTINLVGNDG